MPNRLLLVQPSYYHSKSDRTVFKTRRRHVVPLTLPYLAALTPSDWEITLVDEQLDPVPLDRPFDLIAISTSTLNSFRAYDLADQFRRRGLTVILGGPHTRFHAEEAGEHCDAVGTGEAEGIWIRMLSEARQGKLGRLYEAELLPSLAGLPFPRYELLNLAKYGPFRTFTVVSSRGCPFRCEFCSERLLLGDRYRCRPVPEVVEEIKRCQSHNIFFGDSNFGGKRSHAMELMQQMIPLKLRWSALWSSYLCRDSEFMDLAQRSGLLHLNIGFETIDPQVLEGMNKRFNKVVFYEEILSNLQRRRISYSLNFIFGWDGENPGVFSSTLNFLKRHNVPVAYFNVLTPVKGTRLYDRFKSENRILNDDDIDRWPGQNCYIKPSYSTPFELENNVRKLYREFYSFPSMLRRLRLPLNKAGLASWTINLSERRMNRNTHGQNEFDGF